MYCQTCGGRSWWTLRRLPVGDHRAQRLDFVVEKMLLLGGERAARQREQLVQSGRPEKSSPSHPTVPASIASRSVCDIGGITLRKIRSSAPTRSACARSGAMAIGSSDECQHGEQRAMSLAR